MLHTLKLTVSETVMETMLFSPPSRVSSDSFFSAGVPFVAAGFVSSDVSAPYEFGYGKGVAVLILLITCSV